MQQRYTIIWASMVALVLAACSEKKAEAVASDRAETAAAPAPAPQAAPPEPSPVEKLLATTTLADAVEHVRPLMTDTFDDTSPGAALLGLWSAKHLRWLDVAVAKNETSFARVRKDSASNRGKRMCVRGRIVQIHKDASADLYTGLMLVGYSDIARFIVAGDTGELVERSSARLCGVVIGTYDYTNSGGGTGHAVSLVGMFDLPENRQAAQ